ncbi:hypothetical protein LMG8520_2404 [Lactococcus lactis subsp. lactis]|uniref:Uncharacterized protein n=2 Tax=Lactococcus lactis TaxID=1358 RepID=A0A2A5SAN2_LACLH|nr:hypothetical protein [Lactococcus lactis]KSU05818.1 hypothetical protein LMG8520_2404 [Lactococcus lactis subsp. lactis]PCS10533.1 hypothetical protein RU90_GL001243 [Lactococcus lactis subsp. hordniae]
MWVVLIKKFKFGKQTKSQRYFFKEREKAECFANQQEQHVEIYKSEMQEGK